MTDLESQLRECFSRHASDVAASPTLASGVRTRSRQLSKRSQTAAALAVVPVTAGVVGGAVAIADHGTSPATSTAQIHVAASPSATASHSPQTRTIHLEVCPKGSTIRLKARDGSISVGAAKASRGNAVDRTFHLTTKSRALKAVYYLGAHHRTSSGHLYGIEKLRRDGTRRWSIAVKDDATGRYVNHRADFEGCSAH